MNQAKWLLRLMTIAVAVSAGALAPVAAQTFRTNEVGGPGGAAFSDSCDAGDVLIGINWAAGKALNTIGPVCSQPVQGHVVGRPYGLHTWGTSPAGYFNAFSGAAWCPPDMAIQSLSVAVDGNDNVRRFQISCRNMASGEIELHGKASSMTGGVDAREDVAPCGSGTIATGVIGGHGALIDRLGLICSRFQDQNGKLLAAVGAGGVLPRDKPVRAVGKAVPTGAEGGGVLPKDKPVRAVGKAVPTGPVRKPGDVDNGDDDNGGGNGQAVVGAAIYDAPDGNRVGELNAGDPVTITECGKQFDGWCEISRPRNGWVWGEDLGR